MASLRRRLSLLAFVWMLFQAAGIAVPLVAMQVDGAAVETLCTCDGYDHGTCPMHHPVAPPPTDRRGRPLRSNCAPAATALLALFSAPGTLPTATPSTS